VPHGLSLRVEQAFQRHDIDVGEKLHAAKLRRPQIPHTPYREFA
jgi:hypothetical protein